MKKTNFWLNDSSFTTPLSPACKMCAEGSKMVILITGMCSAKCFYCPLSKEKIGKDRIFADEWELDDEKDIDKLISEAKLINAKGAGITGGDPLFVWTRTNKYISILKQNFGSDFHIHLYTSGLKNGDCINELISSGLDEVRFHPQPKYWKKMDKNPIKKYIKYSVGKGIDTAIEIPAIPKMENDIIFLIKWADALGINYINLNELEFSETNADNLKNNGFTVKNEISAAVKGSQKTALNVLEKISKENYKLGVHYCSSSFKDGVQLKNRIKRRAKNVFKKFEIITDEGTLLKGIIQSEKKPLKIIFLKLKNKYFDLVFYNVKKSRIEIAPWILEEIAKKLKKDGYECFLIEEYPTADRLEVEKIPMPI